MIRSAATVVGALACATHALQTHSHGPSQRKSLAFGPHHPHATFVTDPVPLAGSFATTSKDPFKVARSYVDSLVSSVDTEYVVRPDSYTDKNTGVTHVYFRQLINGLEVADGNINLNIFNGQVISYGDSFYRGDRPTFGVDPAQNEGATTYSQSVYCQQLGNELERRQEQLNGFMASSGQVVFGANPQLQEYIDEHIAPVTALYSSNCALIPTDFHASGELASPAKAALLFMLSAHPDQSFSDSIKNNFDKFLKGITSSFEPHHLHDAAQPVEILHNVPGTTGPVKARLAYVQTPTDTGKTLLNLVWKLEVEMQDNWYEAAVSASNPTKIVEVVDWASDASAPMRRPKKPCHGDANAKVAPVPKPTPVTATYNIWPWGINDPSEGERDIETDPWDKIASPLGWHSLPASHDPLSKNKRYIDPNQIVHYETTWGNNVFSHENWEGRNAWLNNYRPDGSETKSDKKDLVFDYPYKLQSENGTYLDPKTYIDLTITQLFYTCNKIHDLYYRYGFDEPSGNFQQYNFGRGGDDDDGVIANAQDGSGYNNANFMTPPDGQNGRMRMYTWNVHGAPFRDGDFEAGIVIHEFSHGLSTRLTGGPKDSGCLGWGESGGMGEGWGDFLATTIRSHEKYSDYPMGAWAAGQVNGIRYFPYSTNITTNPSTYKTLDGGGYWGVHAIGEVWAEILYIVSNKLIEKHGWSNTLFPPQPNEDGTVPIGDFYRPQEYNADGSPKPLVPKHGNTLITQLVISGMKLQPCRPGFFEARDAIIQADKVLTGGENECTLWAGFSERGLGPKAEVQGRTPWGGGIRKNDFKTTKHCGAVEDPEPEEPEYPEPEDPEDDKKHKKKKKHPKD